MDHPRKLIRKAAVSVLRDARTAAGANVSEHPFNDQAVSIARSIVIEDYSAKLSPGGSAITEAQQEISLDGDTERTYRFCAGIRVKGGTDPAGDRDDLAGQVERALVMAANAGQLGPAKSLRMVGYGADDENEQDQPIRIGLQLFEATYITSGEDPAITL